MNDDTDGNLNVYIEQEDRKLKANIKKLETSDMAGQPNTFEISFVPEIESSCRIEVECLDTNENVLCGNLIKVDVQCIDYVLTPYPLQPFPVNTRSSFNCKCPKKVFFMQKNV